MSMGTSIGGTKQLELEATLLFFLFSYSLQGVDAVFLGIYIYGQVRCSIALTVFKDFTLRFG
jgi:hypothetical protein